MFLSFHLSEECQITDLETERFVVLKGDENNLYFRFRDDLLALEKNDVTRLVYDGNDDTPILRYLAKLTAAKKDQNPAKTRGFFRFTK